MVLDVRPHECPSVGSVRHDAQRPLHARDVRAPDLPAAALAPPPQVAREVARRQVRALLERFTERGDGGDYAEDYVDVSKEAIDELTDALSGLLDGWCKKHGVSPKFHRVLNSKPYPIQATKD